MYSLSCQRAFGLSWVNVEAGNVRHGQKKIWDYEAAGCCHGVVMRHKSWFDGSGCLDQEGHGLRTAETLSSVTEQERGLFWSLGDVDLIFWFIIPTPPDFPSLPFIFHCCLALSLSLSLCLISWWTDIWQAYGCLWWEGAALLRWIWGQQKEEKSPGTSQQGETVVVGLSLVVSCDSTIVNSSQKAMWNIYNVA